MKHHKRHIGKKMLAIILAAATVMSIMPEYVAKAAGAVAEVNGTRYEDIKSAWNAVKGGGTITLLQDWDTKSYKRLVVSDKATVTINLNGHIINRHIASDSSSGSVSDGEVLYIGNDANVTINGGDKAQSHEGRISKNVWYEDETHSDPNYTLYGGVIAGGYSTNGAGGIHIKKNATVTLNNVTLAGNMADYYFGDGYGGAVRIKGSNSTLLLNNSQIVYNYAENYGGGIYVDESSCNITLQNGSKIAYNYVEDNHGGGIYSNAEYTTVKMDDSSEISNNTAKGKGGGIYFRYSKVVVKGGSFKNNESLGGGGGAIYLEPYRVKQSIDSVLIANVTFTGNKGHGDGGAIHSEQENANFSACTITNNYATGKGGGIYIYNDDNAITGSTITNNRSDKEGGGVFLNSLEDMSLGGKVIIKDNTGKGVTSNLYMEEGSYSTSYLTSPPGYGSSVGITASVNRPIIGRSGNYVGKYFFADRENQYVEAMENASIYLRNGTPTETEYAKVSSSPSKEGNIIKGYFSYPSIMDTSTDLDGVYYYSDSYFQNPEKYNEHLATMSICMAMAAFNSNAGNGNEGGTDYTLKSKNIVKLLNDIGVKRDDIYLSNTYTVKPGTGTIGVAIGQKKLDDDGNILVPIAVRGAGYESEWTSNVTVGTGNEADKMEHAGFADAANQVFAQVQSYIKDYGLSDAVKQGKVKFWVAGYSRAGATSNLTARRLIDTYGTENVFAYCMEAPQGAVSSQTDATKYASIHNCINYNDPVPRVAPAVDGYNFTRYGQDKIFNENTNTELRASAIKQLKLVSDDIAYNDRFAIGTVDLFVTSIDKMLFGLNGNMVRAVANPKTAAPKNQGAFMDLFVNKFKDWAVKDRTTFTTAPTGDNDLKENGSSLKSVSFEESLQLVVPIAFSKSDEELGELMDIALQRANELDMTSIYFGPILGKWEKQSKSTKQDWIWNTFWYQVVEPSNGKEGLASKLTTKELTDLKTAWPTLLDTVFTFLSEDYNFTELANSFSYVAGKKVSQASDPGLNVIGTLIYNSDALMQAHYPEVNYAWLRSMDDYYEKETQPVKIENKKSPTVEFSLDQNTYEGDQTLKLTAGEDTQGEGIYYQLTTTVNGETTTSTWLPYNKGIVLPVGTDSNGTQREATYKVDVRAVFCDKEITASKTYTINPITLYNMIVKDTDGTEIQRESYAAGEKVTISAISQQSKFFAGWKEATGITLKDSDKSKKTITFEMPKEDVTLTAEYKNLIDEVKIDDLTAPVGNTDFDKKANVILKGSKVEVENQNEYNVIWTTIDAQNMHEVVTDDKADFNKRYEAVIVLKPEEGKREFADTIQVNVNNNEASGKIEKQKDGSIWVYCGEMQTGNPKFTSAEQIMITAKTGTEIEDLDLPDHVLIQTEAGSKIAAIDTETWTSSNYQKDKAGTYVLTAKLKLSECGVDPSEGTSEAVVEAQVTLEAKAKAATPVLKADSVLPGTYAKNQTIYLETATPNATIMYKLNDGAEQVYDSAAGIQLNIPEGATSGTETNYRIEAYTKSINADEMDDSAWATYEYKIVKPYTVTISYRDTGFAQGTEDAWKKDATVTSYAPGEVVYIIAPEEADEQFAEWETNEQSGITIGEAEKTSKLIKVDKIDKDINLTAVYNPVVSAINLTIPSPVTGEKLAKTVSSCSATITNSYDVLNQFGLTIPITWTPSGNDGTASAYQTYTAKMSMSMDSAAAKFYLSDQLALSVKDDKDENKKVTSTWTIEKDKDGKDTLVIYATFEKTSRVKAVSVIQPDSVEARHGESVDAIKAKLAKKVQVELADGTTAQATVEWSIESYDPAVTTEQKAIAKGTITFPEYVDGNGISEVSAEVYVAAAAKTKTPTANIVGGVYEAEQKIFLSADEGATIYYSTDGTEPTIDDVHKYDGTAISIAEEATTLKAIAVKDGMQNSAIASYTYYIHTHVDTTGDGKCDGIYTGKVDEQGNRILETCDTVLLGRSNDSEGTAASVPGTIAQDDGNGTIYVKVDGSDIVDEVVDDTTGESTKNWKYSNTNYPTTKLTYDYKPEGSDESVEAVKHNYIFAGWYKLESTTTTDDDGAEKTTTEMKPYTEMPKETAYAKFVDATVLDIKAQIVANTTDQSKMTDMRILTSVDALDYESVGFEVNYNNKNISYDSKMVYKKIYALDGTIAVEKDPKEVFQNNLSRSFLALRLLNIPNNMFDVEFNINAYWVTKDGTKVLGSTVVKKVSDAPELSKNE